MFLNLIKIWFFGMHFSLNRQVRFQVVYSVILDTIETNIHYYSNWCRNTEYTLSDQIALIWLLTKWQCGKLNWTGAAIVTENDPHSTIPRILVKCIHYDKIDYSYYICILQASPRARPTGPPRSRHSAVRPPVKPPPIPAYAAHKQSLQHSESPQPSPSAPSKTRPLPPNRPPPPCPITKPSQPAEVSVFLSKCPLYQSCSAMFLNS